MLFGHFINGWLACNIVDKVAAAHEKRIRATKEATYARDGVILVVTRKATEA